MSTGMPRSLAEVYTAFALCVYKPTLIPIRTLMATHRLFEHFLKLSGQYKWEENSKPFAAPFEMPEVVHIVAVSICTIDESISHDDALKMAKIAVQQCTTYSLDTIELYSLLANDYDFLYNVKFVEDRLPSEQELQDEVMAACSTNPDLKRKIGAILDQVTHSNN